MSRFHFPILILEFLGNKIVPSSQPVDQKSAHSALILTIAHSKPIFISTLDRVNFTNTFEEKLIQDNFQSLRLQLSENKGSCVLLNHRNVGSVIGAKQFS